MAWQRLRAIVLAAAAGLAAPGAHAATEADLAKLRLPPGFSVSLFANALTPRSLLVVPELQAVFIGSVSGRLSVALYKDGAPKAERVIGLGDRFNAPNGVAWKDGWLYVAETHRVTRWRPTRDALGPPADPQIVFDQLLNHRGHGFRVIRVGPDNRLWLAIGTPCNVCEPQGLQGTIVRIPRAGGQAEVYARGIRNSVGFDFHPRTGELWFTDNGSDGLGDDIPPEELNHAPRPGLHFGYPYYGGGDTVTREYRGKPPPQNVTFPAFTLGAHTAGLGLHFYRGSMFPPEYREDAFIAQHGSWNRSVPDGYRVMRVHFQNGKPVEATPFMEGFLINKQSWGRPVGLAELPDGSLLVSDDKGNTIFRVAYKKP
jgi:glucose/arabinose dehydrogenase